MKEKKPKKVKAEGFKRDDTQALKRQIIEKQMKGLTILKFHSFTIPLSELKIFKKVKAKTKKKKAKKK